MDGWNLSETLNRPTEELFPDRIASQLKSRHLIQTVGDLVQKSESELLRYGISRELLNEIKEMLAGHQLSLGMRFNANGTLAVPADYSAELAATLLKFENRARVPVQELAVPRAGEYLLYLLLPKDKRECIPGDLQEEFTTIIVPKFGLGYAQLWYCKQVATSILPIIWPQIKKIAGIPAIWAAARHILRYVEFFRRPS